MTDLDHTHALKLGQTVFIVWHIGSFWGFCVIPLAPEAIITEDAVWNIMQCCHAGQSHHVQPYGVWNPILHTKSR